MQTWKVKIFVITLWAAALLAGACGPKTPRPVSGPDSGGGVAGEGAKGGKGKGGMGDLVCESSDDCLDDMICVDGECMIPKLAR